MTQGFVLEMSDSDKVPIFAGQTKFGVGTASAGKKYVVLCVGLKASGATITADAAPVQATTPEEVDTIAGAGGELARMGYGTLRIPGVQLWLAAPSNPGGPTAATATITIGGSPTATGTWRYRIAGDEISGGIATTDTQTTIAAAIVSEITKRPRMRVTAANVAGVVTLTDKSPCARGNDLLVYQDISQLATGVTSALAGGAAVANGAVRFSGGAGTDDLTTLLAALFPGRWNRIAFAQIDSTNAGKIETQLDSKAGPFENRTEHAVLASNAILLTTVTSVSQTTLNEQRVQVLWQKNGETPAPEVAAVFAAYRSVVEQDDPNHNYDDYVLPGVFAQTADADKPNRSTKLSACDAGVTVVDSVGTNALIVRSITSRSQNDAGTAIDDKTVDTGESVVPDWIRDDLQNFWYSDFKPSNPHVQDDVAEGEPDPPAGVATPSLWATEVTSRLLTHQANRLITKVATNPVVAVFNKNAKRIASRVPTVVLPQQHQIECSVEQLAYSSAL